MPNITEEDVHPTEERSKPTENDASSNPDKVEDRECSKGDSVQGAKTFGRGRGGDAPFRRFQERRPPVDIKIPAELIPETAEDITHDNSGKLWKIVLEPGDEAKVVRPRNGMLVQIHYKLWLLNDPEKYIIDSSSLFEGDTEPMEFKLGSRTFIRGLEEGARSMNRVGEKAHLIIHFAYAFGRFSAGRLETPNIPNESMIAAELQLVDLIDDVSSDKMEAREVIREMTKINEDAEPLTNNTVLFVNLEGYYGDHLIFPKRKLPLIVNKKAWGYCADGIKSSSTYKYMPHGLTHGVLTFKKGEAGWIKITGDSAFEMDFKSEVDDIIVPAGGSIRFFAELEDVEFLYDPFQLSLAEKLVKARDCLELGESYLAENNLDAAASKFTSAKVYLECATVFLKTVKPDLIAQHKALLCSAFVNLASLYGKLSSEQMELKAALEFCNEAIKLDKSFGKAYHQRALLQMKQKEFALAKNDFARVITLTKSINLDQERTPAAETRRMYDNAAGGLKEAETKEREQNKSYPFRYVPPK